MREKITETTDTRTTGRRRGGDGAEIRDVLPGLERPVTAVQVADSRLKRQAEVEADAQLARDRREQTLTYTPIDALRFGIPLQRPPASITTWECLTVLDGQTCVVRLIADPKVGLPFGNDLVPLIWCATAFRILRFPEDRIIRVVSGAEMARWQYPQFVGKKVPYWARRQVAESIARWGACFIRILPLNEVGPDQRSPHLCFENQTVIRRAELGFGEPAMKRGRTKKRNQHTLAQLAFTDWIEFTPWGAKLLAHSAPVDAESIYALMSSPLAVRFYLLQAQRSWQLAKQGASAVRVRLFTNMGLTKQLGMTGGPRDCRRQLKDAQDRILKVWRDCPNRLVLDGNHQEREGLYLEPGWAMMTEDGESTLSGVLRDGSAKPVLPPSEGDQRLSIRPRPGVDNSDKG